MVRESDEMIARGLGDLSTVREATNKDEEDQEHLVTLRNASDQSMTHTDLPPPGKVQNIG